MQVAVFPFFKGVLKESCTNFDVYTGMWAPFMLFCKFVNKITQNMLLMDSRISEGFALLNSFTDLNVLFI